MWLCGEKQRKRNSSITAFPPKLLISMSNSTAHGYQQRATSPSISQACGFSHLACMQVSSRQKEVVTGLSDTKGEAQQHWGECSSHQQSLLCEVLSSQYLPYRGRCTHPTKHSVLWMLCMRCGKRWLTSVLSSVSGFSKEHSPCRSFGSMSISLVPARPKTFHCSWRMHMPERLLCFAPVLFHQQYPIPSHAILSYAE